MKFIPTPRELRVSVIAVLVLLFLGAGLLGWVVVHKVNQGNEFARLALSEADQNKALRTEANAERAALRAQIRALELQQHAVVVYLRRHGVKVPQTVFATPWAGSVTRPKVPPAAPPHHRHPKHPGTPPPTMGGGTATGNPLGWLCALLGMTNCPHIL